MVLFYAYRTPIIYAGFRRFNFALYASFRRNFVDGFRLIDGESFHEPAVLLGRNFPDFLWRFGPLEATVFKALIQEDKAVLLPEQPLDTIPAAAAEEKQGLLEGIHLELQLHEGRETIDGFPHIRIATGDKDLTG